MFVSLCGVVLFEGQAPERWAARIVREQSGCPQMLCSSMACREPRSENRSTANEGHEMDEGSQRTALLSALTTEHFVLQTATSSTYTEASARSSLYVMALSSSLVAMGFLSTSPDVLLPFAATVLPAVF